MRNGHVQSSKSGGFEDSRALGGVEGGGTSSFTNYASFAIIQISLRLSLGTDGQTDGSIFAVPAVRVEALPNILVHM
jgi:hypothetical protein